MLKLKSIWTPHDIRTRLPKTGGLGFVFHATDWETVSFAFRGNSVQPEQLWNHGPFIGSPIFDQNQVIGCHIISPLPADLWATSASGIRRFRKVGYHPSMKLAQEAGLTHIGLAALVPYATRFGQLSSAHFNGHRTTGHAATVAAIYLMLKKLENDFSVPIPRLTYAIFGGAGSIGSNVARWLAHNGLRRQVLVDLPNRLTQVQTLCEKLTMEYSDGHFVAHTAETLESGPAFDVGIVATNAGKPWLMERVLHQAPLWIDDSHPQAASQSILTTTDVVYLECCLLAPHGISQTFPFRLPTPRHCYACFAEVYLCWKMQLKNDFVTGRASINQIAMMDELLRKGGFSPSLTASKQGTYIPISRLERACQLLKTRI